MNTKDIVEDIIFFCKGLNVLDIKSQEIVAGYQVDVSVYDANFGNPIYIEFSEEARNEEDLEKMIAIGKWGGNHTFLRVSKKANYKAILRDCLSLILGDNNKLFEDAYFKLLNQLEPSTEVYDYFGESLESLEESGSWDILMLKNTRTKEVVWREEIYMHPVDKS